MSWIDIGYCTCKATCERWGIKADGSVGYFAPYVPENIEHDTNKCRKLCNIRGKNISPHVIK